MVLKKIEELTNRQKNIMMKESCVDKMGWPITFTGPSTENQVGARSRQRHSTGRFGWLKPFVCCNLLGVMFNGIVKALGKTTAFWCRPAEGNELISRLIFVDHSLKKSKDRQYLNFYFSMNHWSVILNSVRGVGGLIFSSRSNWWVVWLDYKFTILFGLKNLQPEEATSIEMEKGVNCIGIFALR